MRLKALAVFAVLSGPAALAQEATIAAPDPGIANYDPTMSAKEAVLANWELAAAGIRAGRIVGDKVVDMARSDVPYGAVLRQAQFAQKTMVQRYHAAGWVYTPGSGVGATDSADALAAAIAAAERPCAAEDCTAERAALEAAFEAATAELDAAALAAHGALIAREDRADAVLMSEQLGLVAEYLESGAWGRDLTLAPFGRDGEEVAARIVGAMTLWRNIEPYVGLTDPEIDAAINTSATNLLRTLRRETRGTGQLAADGPELNAIRDAALVLAAEFRRASALFAS